MPKGIYKNPEVSKRRHSESLKGNTNGFKKGNHPKTEFKRGNPKPKSAYSFPKGKGNPAKRPEVREKLKESGLRSYKRNPELRKQRSESAINNPSRVFKDTSIELKVEAELKRRNINYQKQVPLCKVAIVDFYLPEYRIVIQCDGDYWHNLPNVKERDEKQDRVLSFNGFNVYRFWEYEINKSAQECIDKLF